MTLRSPIVSVLGHVDHGKSSLLDAIRESNIVAKEAGAITQAIGASIIPISTILQRCGSLLKKEQFTIPGLLFIDTPGHAAFTSLRRRGGALADIAVLVVDINEGCKPQTIEAIEILRAARTPFIVAANKLDLIPNYRKREERLVADISSQEEAVRTVIDTRIYELVGELHERFQLQAERFDRVDDYTKQLAIIPCSAQLRHGIAELLMVLTGLAQKFLEEKLRIEVSGPAKGTVLEVKETQGLGITADVIIYDGMLKRNDTIVIASTGEPIVTKVRALLEPTPLAEMRDTKAKFRPVKEVAAATGVKIAAPGLDAVIPGMPLVSTPPNAVEAAKQQLQQELEDIMVATEDKGIIIKADTLGSLEALSKLLEEEGIPIRKAAVGPITKKDIADAESNYETDRLTSVILGFNIPEAKGTERVTIFTSPVIYQLIDDYKAWRDAQRTAMQQEALAKLTPVCKLEILQNCLFRQSNPAIVGVEVLAGTLRTGTRLMKLDGTRVAAVKAIQQEQKNLVKAEKGFQVAISLPGAVVGRHIDEHDILLSELDESEFRAYKEYRDILNAEQKELLKQLAEIKRKQNPVWGV
ncbi:translation initiation factor IF-2 [Candidatus Woesearchaeota archaeon]|nr:MAG: translation initiation factor IF-2 [Candidatus Woesearchaeota archaeon]